MGILRQSDVYQCPCLDAVGDDLFLEPRWLLTNAVNGVGVMGQGVRLALLRDDALDSPNSASGGGFGTGVNAPTVQLDPLCQCSLAMVGCD